MINKLIRGRIIEIIVVIILVGLSIPVWQNIERRISSASITTAEEYNLEFKIETKGTKEVLTVNNRYHINKKYKIFLEIDENASTSDTKIVINNEIYNLDSFNCEKKRNKYIYTLINDYITFLSSSYEIEFLTSEKNISYTYNFEESINF